MFLIRIIRPVNKVLTLAFALTVLFFVLVALTPINLLIAVLNGIFIGAVTTIVFTYGHIFWDSILRSAPYDRVRQMTVGFAACWLAYTLNVAVSIGYHTLESDVNPSVALAASRYIAILAAVLQVTAPDFGLGILHSRSRRTLTSGLFIGVLVAVWIISFQGAPLSTAE
jgi:hypothetical protein